MTTQSETQIALRDVTLMLVTSLTAVACAVAASLTDYDPEWLDLSIYAGWTTIIACGLALVYHYHVALEKSQQFLCGRSLALLFALTTAVGVIGWSIYAISA